MGGFQQPRQFVSRNHRDILSSTPPDNNDFLIGGNSIQDIREILPKAGIGGFHRNVR
ncbi:MAG TPA: hypothetical protein VJX16_12835 [Terriglobales bacterium]|nr:hypothetical protein [Terriglobales bacterium]